MVHKPKHKVHSFRGLLGQAGQDEINLERSNVNLAYRIIKFSLQFHNPGTASTEHVVQIFRESQSSVTGVINFSDPDLLAAGFLSGSTSATYPEDILVVFDNVLFSRNIYVTHSDVAGAESCNYYIEIEEVPVSTATLMQLKLGVARKLNLSQAPPDA